MIRKLITIKRNVEISGLVFWILVFMWGSFCKSIDKAGTNVVFIPKAN